MGVTAAVIGGALLGVGASALMSKQQAKQMPSMDYRKLQPNLPSAPVMPVMKPEDSGVTDNASMEAEREREKNAALMRQLQAPEIATSGLGAHGQATLNKKSLLGG